MSMFDTALGLHGQALSVRNQRVEVLARNIANADTPHFKARDVDFKQILRDTVGERLNTTRQNHMPVAVAGDPSNTGMLYRVPFNVAFDGNTVELNIEQAQYGKAAADYQATLNLFQNDVSVLRKSLRGE